MAKKYLPAAAFVCLLFIAPATGAEFKGDGMLTTSAHDTNTRVTVKDSGITSITFDRNGNVTEVVHDPDAPGLGITLDVTPQHAENVREAIKKHGGRAADWLDRTFEKHGVRFEKPQK